MLQGDSQLWFSCEVGVQVDGAMGGVSDQFATPKTSKKVGLRCGKCFDVFNIAGSSQEGGAGVQVAGHRQAGVARDR